MQVEDERLSQIGSDDLQARIGKRIHVEQNQNNPQELKSTGKTILSASTIGSTRYKMKELADAWALCDVYGKPDLYITMTCNPNWPEIKDFLLPGQNAQDNPCNMHYTMSPLNLDIKETNKFQDVCSRGERRRFICPQEFGIDRIIRVYLYHGWTLVFHFSFRMTYIHLFNFLYLHFHFLLFIFYLVSFFPKQR